MNRIAYTILMTALLAGCTTAPSPPILQEAKDLDEVLRMLDGAKKLELQGELPGRWVVKFTKYEPLVTLPLTVESPETIHALADLIRVCDFKFDPEMTKSFRDGTTIGTSIGLTIEVDGKARIYFLAEDMIICRDMKTYVTRRDGKDDDTYFAREVAVILKRFADQTTKKDAQQSSGGDSSTRAARASEPPQK